MFKPRFVSFLVAALAVTQLTGCGIQAIPRADNDVDAASAEVTNQYKRRADLIPNLVNTVKGYAAHEKETLEGVTEARAKATSMNIDPSKATPEQVAAFQKAQGQLSQALGRLMVVAEKYPELKADANFRDLQAQIEGTENRITVARNRYIDAVRNYNVTVRSFPANLTAKLFGFAVKPNFTVENESAIAVAPT